MYWSIITCITAKGFVVVIVVVTSTRIESSVLQQQILKQEPCGTQAQTTKEPTYVFGVRACVGLESDAHAAPLSIKGRPATVSAVYRSIDLHRQQLGVAVGIGGHFNAGHDPRSHRYLPRKKEGMKQRRLVHIWAGKKERTRMGMQRRLSGVF
jgi:hypothetical protein